MTKVSNEEQSNNANVLLGVVLTYDGTPEQHADEIVTYLTDADPHAINTLFSIASTI
jgi:hypothetical protein